MPPHVCFKCKCGEHAREFFVDIGADTEYDGTIYLCDSCMEDLGRSTEMFFSKEAFETKVEFNALKMQMLQDEMDEFMRIRRLWKQHFDTSLVQFFNNLEEVANGITGDTESNSDTGESNVEGEQDSLGDNVIPFVPNSTDSSGSSEETSGETITAPVIPIFS